MNKGEYKIYCKAGFQLRDGNYGAATGAHLHLFLVRAIEQPLLKTSHIHLTNNNELNKPANKKRIHGQSVRPSPFHQNEFRRPSFCPLLVVMWLNSFLPFSNVLSLQTWIHWSGGAHLEFVRNHVPQPLVIDNSKENLNLKNLIPKV